MTVRSYAQNFEDVLLWRALRHVEAGHYIDVGAGHPKHHSVTKLFYDSGWSGINIEPLPHLASALENDRTRDLTVQAAVSSQDGETIDFTIVDLWDELSTTLPDRAMELRDAGRDITTIQVPTVRLDDLVARSGFEQIHFLKVDVEGAELDVLRTMDLRRTRPWIILTEAVAGGREVDSHSAVRALLEDHNYVHAYFDGLNDFFVSGERAEALLPHFAVPVNVTDDFISASESDQVIVELIATKLGLTPPVDASEVLQRVEGVLRDRIAFESRLNALESTTRPEPGVPAPLSFYEEQMRSLRLKCETLEQTSFERERLVAWYATEVANHRRRAQMHAHEMELLRHQAEDAEQRFAAVTRSTSWRTTLPIRAARRPRTYLRKMLIGS